MRRILSWSLCGLLAVSMAHAADAPKLPMTEANNAAAGYAGTLNFYVGRMAFACESVLGRPEGFDKTVVAQWRAHGENGRLFAGAVAYLGDSLKFIEQTQGDDAGNAFFAATSRPAIEKAKAEVASEVTGTNEQKTATCHRFLAHVADGSLDITSKSEHYQALSRMADAAAGHP
ncbi:hypothetical protein [Dyella sp.]|uniref:hypothetical protein n=1 Tax=Dyella sp. TaxID=1869338 RepID=UPI002ED1D520